jgi:hypothetical protein
MAVQQHAAARALRCTSLNTTVRILLYLEVPHLTSPTSSQVKSGPGEVKALVGTYLEVASCYCTVPCEASCSKQYYLEVASYLEVGSSYLEVVVPRSSYLEVGLVRESGREHGA